MNCKVFQNLSVNEKFELLKKKGICFSCLKGIHLSKQCSFRKACELTDHQNNKCGRFHHPSLHQQAHLDGITLHNSKERGGNNQKQSTSYGQYSI